MADEFVAYRGDPDIHDGTVLEVRREGDSVRVTVRGASGKRFEIAFSGVDSVADHRAEGMLFYALTEMSSEPPLRRFVFANWNEDDEARLEVSALSFDCQQVAGD